MVVEDQSIDCTSLEEIPSNILDGPAPNYQKQQTNEVTMETLLSYGGYIWYM